VRGGRQAGAVDIRVEVLYPFALHDAEPVRERQRLASLICWICQSSHTVDRLHGIATDRLAETHEGSQEHADSLIRKTTGNPARPSRSWLSATGMTFRSGTETGLHYNSLLALGHEREFAAREAVAERAGLLALAVSAPKTLPRWAVRRAAGSVPDIRPIATLPKRTWQIIPDALQPPSAGWTVCWTAVGVVLIRAHRPFHTGSRFSANALAPSSWSSLS